MRLLVTGALGYIGSHFCFMALKQGHELLLLDNAMHDTAMLALGAIRAQAQEPEAVLFFNLDVRDAPALHNFFQNNQGIDAVIHFAALKNAPASLLEPVDYYQNNVLGSLNLLEAMARVHINRIVFSSTAAVYAPDASQPCDEESMINPLTPYGKSKHMTEVMLSDLAAANKAFQAVALRYFNVAGVDSSGALTSLLLADKDTSLLSAILKVASGKKEYLSVYGNDYETRDGTAIRDYIHVLDVADAHLQALRFMETEAGFHVFNLGLGEGCTVLEMVREFERVNGVTIPMEQKARRPGALMAVYANIARAQGELGWRPQRDLARMVKDVWRS